MKSEAQPDYQARTIALKNEHINQLIQELQMTKDLHSNLKKKYQNDENALKNKVYELENLIEELRGENCMLIRKYEEVEGARSGADEEKRRELGLLERSMKELRATAEMLRLENGRLELENKEMAEKLEMMEVQMNNKNGEICSLQKQFDQRNEEIAATFKEYMLREEQFKKNSEAIKLELKYYEDKSKQKKKIALGEIENRIIGIMTSM